MSGEGSFRRIPRHEWAARVSLPRDTRHAKNENLLPLDGGGFFSFRPHVRYAVSREAVASANATRSIPPRATFIAASPNSCRPCKRMTPSDVGANWLVRFLRAHRPPVSRL